MEDDDGLAVQVNARVVSGTGRLQSHFAIEQQKLLYSGRSWETAFADLKELKVVMVLAEKDKKERRIAIVNAANLTRAFKMNPENVNRSLLYSLFIFHALSQELFVVVHVHDGMSELPRVYLGWLSNLYKLIPSANLKSIAKIYIQTSSKRLRSRLWLPKTFSSAKIWKKIECIHCKDTLSEKLGCSLSDSSAPHESHIEPDSKIGFGASIMASFRSSPKTRDWSSKTAYSSASSTRLISPNDNVRREPTVLSRGMSSSTHLLQNEPSGSKRPFLRVAMSGEGDILDTFRTFAPDIIGGYESEQEGTSASSFELDDSESGESLQCFLTDPCISSKDPVITSPQPKVSTNLEQDIKNSQESSFRSKMFGCPLTCGCPNGSFIPAVVLDCVEYLLHHGCCEEGLFRIPGEDREILQLKAAYNSGLRPLHTSAMGCVDEKQPSASNKNQTPSVNSVGSLLKAYFRELPTPIVPSDRFEYILGLSDDIADQVTLAYQLCDAMLALPQENFNTLGFLFHFLSMLVNDHVTQTKMNLQNLTIVWTPNILSRSNHHHEQQQSMHEMNPYSAIHHLAELSRAARAVSCMIANVDIIFPKEMLSVVPSKESSNLSLCQDR